MQPPHRDQPTLVQYMCERTRHLHSQAERSGIVAAILAGSATRSGYALYLRNLLPAYQAMEQALQRRRAEPGIAGLAQEPLFRAAGIAADLEDLAGRDWRFALPLLGSGERYGARIAAVADDPRLIAHVYTRYLGDLNRGRVLRAQLLRGFGPDFPMRFMALPAMPDAAAFSQALNAAGERVVDTDAIVQEAAMAFELSIAISTEVAALT